MGANELINLKSATLCILIKCLGKMWFVILLPWLTTERLKYLTKYSEVSIHRESLYLCTLSTTAPIFIQH